MVSSSNQAHPNCISSRQLLLWRMVCRVHRCFLKHHNSLLSITGLWQQLHSSRGAHCGASLWSFTDPQTSGHPTPRKEQQAVMGTGCPRLQLILLEREERHSGDRKHVCLATGPTGGLHASLPLVVLEGRWSKLSLGRKHGAVTSWSSSFQTTLSPQEESQDCQPHHCLQLHCTQAPVSVWARASSCAKPTDPSTLCQQTSGN